MIIYTVSLLSQVNVFIHYGIMPEKASKISKQTSEVFRLVKFQLLFNYFISRSEDLLESGQLKRRIIKATILFFFILTIVLGLVIIIGSYNFEDEDTKNFEINIYEQCADPFWLTQRSSPLIFSVIFFFVFKEIKQGIKHQEVQTEKENILMLLQLRTISKINKA